MKRYIPALGLGLVLTGCGGGPKIISAVATPNAIPRAGTITMTVEVEDFELGGHIHTYLDNTETNPLAQTTRTSFPVVISSSTAPGAHKLIVAPHGEDHRTLEPEVAITVE
jgi:hypothetical protein